MTRKTTFVKALLISLSPFLLTVPGAQAQTYCYPVFSYGCSLWSNQSITFDSIHFMVDPYYCDLFDYTGLSTTLNAGASSPMQVVNGNWCGCGVWIDFNLDGGFDTTENLFHSYQANEINTYSFSITIPANTPAGAYRMRVIAGWGSDCYNPGSNGYGPCGLYQYGNFDDFTIHVTDIGTGTTDLPGILPSVKVEPNPAATSVMVTIKDAHSGILQLTNIVGEIIYIVPVKGENEVLGVSTLPNGIYLLHYYDGIHRQSMKLIKE
ncbi:MAG TPA: T9SS type A sorting domain-containing protein [Chitinophagales bacterium]|nr:T9SS type A sorting domain-containing protein [Chitinophagales bacterium]